MDAKDKIQVVFEGLGSEQNISDVCKKYGISRRTFYNWKHEIESGALEHLESKHPGRKQKERFESMSEAETVCKEQEKKIAALEKENEGLKIQRDFYEFVLKNRYGDSVKKKEEKSK